MSGRHSGFVTTPTGHRLYERWHPAPEPRASVAVIHGFGEHSGRYLHVFEALNAGGFNALGLDYRGYGQASGRRGFVERFDEYLDDAGFAAGRARERGEGLPVFMLGHSQGGLVTAAYALERDHGLAGMALSSPGFGVALAVPAWKDGLARLLSRLVPGFGLPTDLGGAEVTRDPDVAAAYDADPLMVRRATARWYVEFLAAQVRVMAGADRITLPTLVMQAGADRVVAASASRRFFDQLGSKDKEFISYEGLFHEIMNEPERDRVLGDLVAWLRARSG
ncbi:MAG: lysophospholipase [Deltaproteobacteria bacterium]|nr:lysophospholipase [Deltaproteobacteria bacterium]MCB9786784.1 lysophospholipase [Deltaproteobacteria bacterium]